MCSEGFDEVKLPCRIVFKTVNLSVDFRPSKVIFVIGRAEWNVQVSWSLFCPSKKYNRVKGFGEDNLQFRIVLNTVNLSFDFVPPITLIVLGGA